MHNFLQQIINGVSLGGVYALMAVGYTMVYGIIKLINFAHCDIYMVGAYTGYFVVNTLGLGFFPALLASMLFCAILGVVIERVAYKPLRKSAKETLLITTIGIELLLQNLVKTDLFAGPNTLNFPEVLKSKIISFAGLQVSNLQIIALSVTIVLCIVLQLMIDKTSTGRAMRATAYDSDAAALMGINVDRVISITFMIGSALAATAGVLVGLLYPKLEPTMGVMPGLKAFVAAVLGGIGVVPGAVFGGIAIGLTETLSKVYISSGFSDAIAFAILIIVLLVKPTGLFGKKKSVKV
ncbi:branched-chain amino acid ABC transporter permease [Lachnospiraceae bacterium ZAX-1]